MGFGEGSGGFFRRLGSCCGRRTVRGHSGQRHRWSKLSAPHCTEKSVKIHCCSMIACLWQSTDASVSYTMGMAMCNSVQQQSLNICKLCMHDNGMSLLANRQSHTLHTTSINTLLKPNIYCFVVCAVHPSVSLVFRNKLGAANPRCPNERLFKP